MKNRHQELFAEIKEKFSHMGEDTTTADSRVLIVDGLNTFIRVFAAVPVCNDNGVHIGGISGFLRSIGYAIRIVRPTRVIVVFDGKGGSQRRRKIYPEYKAHRAPQLRLNRSDIFQNDEEEQKMMHHELIRVVQYVSELPVNMFAVDNVEADDVIAYITNLPMFSESKVTIMSADKDFLQLVSNRVSVWSPTKKKMYDPTAVKEEFGVMPENITLFRSIGSRSDKSDNIRGVDGFGDKTIMKKVPLLCAFPTTIDEVFADVQQRAEGDKLLTRLLENRSIVERNYSLMQLSDVDISANAKLTVVDKLRAPIPVLNTIKVLSMVLEDKLEAGIPNIQVWLREHFGQIDMFARMTHKSKVDNDKQ
jgi:DNA polymerase-1